MDQEEQRDTAEELEAAMTPFRENMRLVFKTRVQRGGRDGLPQ